MRCFMVGAMLAVVVHQPPDVDASGHASGHTPFVLHRNHLVLVTGAIGDARDLVMLLDTGAGRTIISRNAAAALKLAGVPTRLHAFGQQVDGMETTVPDLTAGEFRVSRHPVVVVDLADTAAALQVGRLDAIIGLDVLRTRSFGLDFAARCLVFGARRQTRHRSLFSSHPVFVVVEGRVARRTVRLIVDTGASHLVLFAPRTADSASRTTNAARLAGGAPVGMVSVEELRIGSWITRGLSALTLSVPASAGPNVDGLLGLSALGADYVEFDFERHEIGWGR